MNKILQILLFSLAAMSIQPNIHGMACFGKPKQIYKNWVQKRKDSALEDALEQNRYDAAEKALKKGANSNGKIATHDPFINIPIVKCNEDMVELLLQYKADPDGDTLGYESALIRAVEFNSNSSIFNLLLAHNPHVKYEAQEIGKLTIVSCLACVDIGRFNRNDRVSCILAIMENSECDDDFIVSAYNYIKDKKRGEDREKAEELLDEARLEDYKRKKLALIAVLAEKTPFFAPLQKIVADYGTEYYCMQIRPLAIAHSLAEA